MNECQQCLGLKEVVSSFEGIKLIIPCWKCLTETTEQRNIMPNWCENNLVMYGPSDDVNTLYTKSVSEDKNFDMLETFLPTPTELLGNREILESEQGDFVKTDNGWYDWRIENWGTKWEMNGKDFPVDRIFTLEGDEENRKAYQKIQILFDTAWSPPEAGIQNISKLFPNVHFFMSYKEEGMGFEGYIYCYNGEVIDSDYVNKILPNADNFWDGTDYWIDIAQDSISNNKGE